MQQPKRYECEDLKEKDDFAVKGTSNDTHFTWWSTEIWSLTAKKDTKNRDWMNSQIFKNQLWAGPSWTWWAKKKRLLHSTSTRLRDDDHVKEPTVTQDGKKKVHVTHQLSEGATLEENVGLIMKWIQLNSRLRAYSHIHTLVIFQTGNSLRIWNNVETLVILFKELGAYFQILHFLCILDIMYFGTELDY